MKHRIVVLGAGYAGSYVAGTLARRLSPADTEIAPRAAPNGWSRCSPTTRPRSPTAPA